MTTHKSLPENPSLDYERKQAKALVKAVKARNASAIARVRRQFSDCDLPISRRQTGPALDEPDSDVPRRADFVLKTPAAASIRLKGDAPEGWTQTLVMRAGKGVQLHRSDFQAQYISGWNYWKFDLLPRRVSLHIVVVREPLVKKGDDPHENEEQRRPNWKNRVEIFSPAIRLDDPQRYDIRATVTADADSGKPYILVDSVADAVGADRTEELVDRKGSFGPPVDAGFRP